MPPRRSIPPSQSARTFLSQINRIHSRNIVFRVVRRLCEHAPSTVEDQSDRFIKLCVWHIPVQQTLPSQSFQTFAIFLIFLSLGDRHLQTLYRYRPDKFRFSASFQGNPLYVLDALNSSSVHQIYFLRIFRQKQSICNHQYFHHLRSVYAFLCKTFHTGCQWMRRDLSSSLSFESQALSRIAPIAE